MLEPILNILKAGTASMSLKNQIDPDRSRADQSAIERMLAAQPQWQGVVQAQAVLELDGQMLLHAGPPVRDPRELTTPLLNSAVMAVLFEGWAQDQASAQALLRSGKIRLEPAQDRHVAVPLADVLSPSMFVQVVAARDNQDCRAYSPLNGGGTEVIRVGLCNPAVLEQLRWVNGELAATLREVFGDPLALIELADTGLSLGDDCHGQTAHATDALTQLLSQRLGSAAADVRCRTFLQRSPGFFLNLWMAATKCIMRAAQGIADSSVITGMGGNGFEFGIQLAGRPRHWITVPASPPLAVGAPFDATRALGAIGDSAIVDAFGFGAMAPGHAQRSAQALSSIAGGATLSPQAFLAAHPGFPLSGARVGLAAATVCEQQAAPIISLGVLDNRGIDGRLGPGLYQPPVAVFMTACEALRNSR